MKKLWISMAIVIIACIGLGAVLTACGNNTHPNYAAGIDTPEEFYAYGVASVGTLLQTAQQPTVASAAMQTAPQNGNGNNGSTELTPEQLEKVGFYLPLVESLLQDNPIQSATTQSDREEYATKTVVTVRDWDGETAQYTMYYNTEEIAAPRDYDDDDEDDDDKDEQKAHYRISGIMIVDEQEYPVSGQMKKESEPGETEDKSFFRADLGENSVIEIRMETENEQELGEQETEQKFVHSFYQDGQLVERTVMEYEQEEDETELLVSITRDGEKRVLRFEEETAKDGTRCIRVMSNVNGEMTQFRVYVTYNEQGEPIYRYVFAGGGQYEQHRNGHRHNA